MFMAFLAAAAAVSPRAGTSPALGRMVGVASIVEDRATKPTPIDMASWFSWDDYPVDARQAGKEGSVRFRVDVDAAGRPTACKILKSSGTPSLDQTTCRIVLAKAKFTPARANRKAVASSYENSAVWRLSGGVPTSGGYFAAIVDFKDVEHPQCSIVQKGMIGPSACDQVLTHYGSYGKTYGLKKFVELLSVTMGDGEPYRGEADWGRRLSFTSIDLYLIKGGKRSCVVIAATGEMADPAPCAPFNATAVLSDQEKKAATKQHFERSMFAVVRRDSGSGSCKAADGERPGCS